MVSLHTKKWAYYNDNDPKVCAWVQELIKADLIAPGEVDERSIEDVQPTDLVGFRQVHMFCGIGGWSYALRLAGWSDDRHCWTFSCPCQRFSSAARGRTVAPDMWPAQRRLIDTNRPRVFFGEQVGTARAWFDRLCSDVAAMGYDVGAAILPACGFGFDHARPRIVFVGNTDCDRQSSLFVDAEMDRLPWRRSDGGGVLSANGLPDRVAQLAAFGNAIVPVVAAEVIAAYMEIMEAR